MPVKIARQSDYSRRRIAKGKVRNIRQLYFLITVYPCRDLLLILFVQLRCIHFVLFPPKRNRIFGDDVPELFIEIFRNVTTREKNESTWINSRFPRQGVNHNREIVFTFHERWKENIGRGDDRRPSHTVCSVLYF